LRQADNMPEVKRRRAVEPQAEAAAGSGTGAAAPVSAFAAALGKVLARDLSGKATPVLAKRRTAQEKHADRAAIAAREEKKLRKSRKKLRKLHLVAPAPQGSDFERQLRKVATKGVVALFNAISKHQRTIETATDDVTKPSAKAAVVATQNKSFLELLRKSTTASTPSAGGGKEGGSGTWGALSDDFVHTTAKNVAPAKGKGEGGGRGGAAKRGLANLLEDGLDGGY
jgi:hypothetical protein